MIRIILSMVLTCLSALAAIAQETATIGGIEYHLQNGEATVMKQTATFSGNVVIPEKVSYNNEEYVVTSLSTSAFSDQNAITSIQLPNSIIEIGARCVSSCDALATVDLPDNITSLPDYCFSYCKSLNSITLPNNITSLGDYCFRVCSSLNSITLPNNITSLGDHCFSVCSSLNSITLPNSITSLGRDCFKKCDNLSSITLPNSITSLGDYCFTDCSNLSSITLPNSIKIIPQGCFSNCRSLESIILPKNITKLRPFCFNNCINLMDVTCEWDKVNGEYASDAFDGIFTEARLHVPVGTKALYQAKEPWKSFKYIIEDVETTEPLGQCATPTISYDNETKTLTFYSSTEGADYHYTISDKDIKENAYSDEGVVRLTTKYDISVLASAEGYTSSDEATATLYFVTTELETTDIATVDGKRGILVSSDETKVTVSGLNNGETVALYDLQGIKLCSGKAVTAGSVDLNTGGRHGVMILRIGNEAIKVNVK